MEIRNLMKNLVSLGLLFLFQGVIVFTLFYIIAANDSSMLVRFGVEWAILMLVPVLAVGSFFLFNLSFKVIFLDLSNWLRVLTILFFLLVAWKSNMYIGLSAVVMATGDGP